MCGLPKLALKAQTVVPALAAAVTPNRSVKVIADGKRLIPSLLPFRPAVSSRGHCPGYQCPVRGTAMTSVKLRTSGGENYGYSPTGRPARSLSDRSHCGLSFKERRTSDPCNSLSQRNGGEMKAHPSAPELWPVLPWEEWKETATTLHMWMQIVGKTRLALTPLENHWWNVPLYVTPRGLTTSVIPYGRGAFSVDFDFIAHKLWIRTSADREVSIGLYPRSVADFYTEYMAALRSLGIEVRIYSVPCEFDDLTPFD